MAYIESSGIGIHKKKNRRWIISVVASSLIAIAAIISTTYFAWQNQSVMKSLYNFQPFIYSINASSTLKSGDCTRNQTVVVISGLVAVNLKVVTPYDGLLTIDIMTLNAASADTSELDMTSANLNYTEHSPCFLGTTIHQYFISKNVINSIEDKLPVQLIVILEPNWISPSNLGIGFPLGNLMFEANLYSVQTNQTITKTFFEDIHGEFTPTS